MLKSICSAVAMASVATLACGSVASAQEYNGGYQQGPDPYAQQQYQRQQGYDDQRRQYDDRSYRYDRHHSRRGYGNRNYSYNNRYYRGQAYGQTYCHQRSGTTGTIVGAVGGGLLGNVIARGTAGTLIGAGAGALLGRNVERHGMGEKC